MVTETINTGIQTISVVAANNIYPSFVGADSDEGTTVIKHLHSKVYEEVYLMWVMRLNHHTFSTDNHLTKRDKTILNPFGEDGLDFSNRYEIRRKSNTFYIQKINGKGKVFRFSIHVSVRDNKLKYSYVWKNKKRDFIDGKKVKMRMYASHQLGINLTKVYKLAV